jgi:hypothetical protein
MNTDPATKPNLFIFAFIIVWRRAAHLDESGVEEMLISPSVQSKI